MKSNIGFKLGPNAFAGKKLWTASGYWVRNDASCVVEIRGVVGESKITYTIETNTAFHDIDKSYESTIQFKKLKLDVNSLINHKIIWNENFHSIYIEGPSCLDIRSDGHILEIKVKSCDEWDDWITFLDDPYAYYKKHGY